MKKFEKYYIPPDKRNVTYKFTGKENRYDKRICKTKSCKISTPLCIECIFYLNSIEDGAFVRYIKSLRGDWDE